ncbi:hypothetical protein EW026_g329 [Hermanssonia centrifuga]|uniref:Uncharacterized protein n=1 Tax=Hermanssonia centrifuga TaxID=98765 RepID=A0A4S4KW17_9APHY|nr:hypothetical protein EW026_g329 [Hermanssonia centrifuga]
MQRRPAMAHRLSVPAVHYPTLTSAHQRSASGYPYNSPGRPPIPLPPINASAGLNESYEFPPPSLSAPSTQPHSPSTASPPPISQSFVNGGLNGHAAALGRMGMHGAYAISSRSVPAPIPGPLPEPSFSFGMASTSPAIANASPSSSNTSLTVTHMEGGEGDVEDDASALSSNFDPYSRWNSLASMAGSDSSLTSYWSEAAQNGKESGENYDAARRGSVVSGVLPELFGELDVNGNGGSTPQPQPLTDSPREIHVVAPSSPEERRRASVGGSPEGEAYAMQTQSTFQDQTGFSPHSYSPHQQQGVYPPQEQSGYVLHAQHNGYPPPHEQNRYTLDEHSPYSSHDTGSYSPSSTSTVSAGNLKDGSPTMLRQSTSSELAHALQARPISGTEDVIPNHGAQLLYPSDFPDGPGPDHLDHNQSLSPKSVHYSPEPFPNPQSAYYSQQQQQQPPPLVDYPYDVYNGTPMFPSGAIELDHMCVPSPMVMENMQGGDYMSYS